MTTFVVITHEVLQCFTHQAFRRPGLDLQTGEIIELAPPAESEPVQLELPFAASIRLVEGNNSLPIGNT